jgi:hypothetical protein
VNNAIVGAGIAMLLLWVRNYFTPIAGARKPAEPPEHRQTVPGAGTP